MALARPALAALSVLALAFVPGVQAAPAPASAQVVLYKDATSNPPAQTRKRERELNFSATHRYRHAVGGFAAHLTEAQVDDLRNDPAVAAVVPDRPVHADLLPVAAGET